MNRAPSFQFYPRDWLDFKVQRMSLSAQGAYLKLLCYMWNDSKDQCSIADDDELIARGLGTSVDTWVRLRVEIQNDSDPILATENGCLVSRRLKAEASKQRKYRKLQALKGTLSGQRRSNRGSTAVQPEHQPDANSSSTSSSSSSGLRSESGALKPNLEAKRGPPAARRSSRAPDSFPITAELRLWAAAEVPGVDLEAATREWLDYWRGVGKPMLDWDATWRNGMRRAAALPVNGSGHPAKPRRRPIEELGGDTLQSETPTYSRGRRP